MLQSMGLQRVRKDWVTEQQIYGETMKTGTDFIFFGSKITADGDCSPEIIKRRCSLEEML